MAEVLLENVTKIYPGDVIAVDRLSLHVHDREFLVLVGPSGCGKSTTLRLIAGLEDITSGTIRIGDRVVNEVAPKDRDIAMVFQNYALYPHMTVYKNMAFGLLMRRKYGGWDHPLGMIFGGSKYRQARDERREIDRRVRSAAEMLGIQGLLHRRPKALSGGQRQRVALGRAIVREPKAFLFDEPLSNLDAKLRVETRAELKRLHRRVQTTTIYVTHDQEEAMTLGDRLAVMKDGIVQQLGTPFEIYEQPASRFVAGFLGTPPMNFLEGNLTRANGGLLFVDGAHRLAVSSVHADKLAAHVDRTVVLGIRPDNLTPATAASATGVGSSLFEREPPTNSSTDSTEDCLHATVEVLEPLGERMDISFSTPRHANLICRTDSRHRVRDGERLGMHVDMARVHYFETSATGRNLCMAGAFQTSS